MIETPIKREIVDGLVAELGIKDFAKATIREVKQVAAKSEKASGVEFIKMEMGIPGLPAAQVGVDAQIKALQDGIAHSYPDIQGAPVLKEAASLFVKAFIESTSNPRVACPSVVPCRALSPRSLPVRNATSRRIPCSSSTLVSLYRRCSSR